MRTSREYVTSSGSEGEDGAVGAAAPVAAAPAAPAGALESSRPAWHRFTRQRMQLWAKWDQVRGFPLSERAAATVRPV